MDFWYVAFELIKVIAVVTPIIAIGTAVLYLLMVLVLKVFRFLILIIAGLYMLHLSRMWAPRGYTYIELPMNTITMEFKKNDYSFSLGYGAPRDLRRKKDTSLKDSCEENRRTVYEIQNEFAAVLAENFPCIFDAEGYWYDEYPPETVDEERVFELDSEDLKEWLADQEKIVNNRGQTVAVRGINEGTINELWRRERIVAESGDGSIFELIIPNEKEEALCKKKQEELWIYQDIKKCKFKICNASYRKLQFRFSQAPGYTKSDMIQKAKEFAESKGYKFKITE